MHPPVLERKSALTAICGLAMLVALAGPAVACIWIKGATVENKTVKVDSRTIESGRQPR
jgi:hypothetical protein